MTRAAEIKLTIQRGKKKFRVEFGGRFYDYETVQEMLKAWPCVFPQWVEKGREY